MSDEEQLKNMRNLACVLHSTYFGTLQALRREEGFLLDLRAGGQGDRQHTNGVLYFNFLEAEELADILERLDRHISGP
ncbi:hypothetical protein DRO42_04860 [Candidatus Bathyarchaeota archaeon]|nr:MAG: hypothetical protein DRO42_04860 [Candidatus Bathyarchaeota archaeon]